MLRIQNTFSVWDRHVLRSSKPLRGFIFFFKQKTAYEVLLCDWSSDVCSSDLRRGLRIFDEMRKDDQVKAALAFKKHTVTATDWIVSSPEGMPADWEPTLFVRWVLQHLDPEEVGGGTLDHDLQE